MRIYQLVGQVATTPTTVLITGESDTGTKLIARAIHRLSPRGDKPFVAMNVASPARSCTVQASSLAVPMAITPARLTKWGTPLRGAPQT